ncbi:hypothetical protein BDV93DRAFT_545056, partial [Ceratobasidium sp. AG-I]
MQLLHLLSFCVCAFHNLTPAAAQASRNLVQLDDTYAYSPTLETGIQYSPGWLHFTGDQAQGRHGQSVSTTNALQASLVLFFRGDSISYIGDIYTHYAHARVSIDGGDPQLVDDAPVWWTGTMVEGDHQIVITKSTDSGFEWMSIVSNPDDWRPSLMGPGATSVPEGALLVDDGHSHVNYLGTWGTIDSNDRSFFFGGHEHTTSTPGASLTFSFNGTAVWYFSDKRAQNGWVLISVDGSKGELVSTFLPDSDSRWVLCWEKTGLSDGEHNVTITHADVLGLYVSLDFFKYMPSSAASTPASSKLPRGALIGVAAGSGALLIIILAALIYWITRSRKVRETGNDNSAKIEESVDEATDKDASLASQPATPGPRVSYLSEAWAPNNSADTTSACQRLFRYHTDLADMCDTAVKTGGDSAHEPRVAASDIVYWPPRVHVLESTCFWCDSTRCCHNRRWATPRRHTPHSGQIFKHLGEFVVFDNSKSQHTPTSYSLFDLGN